MRAPYQTVYAARTMSAAYLPPALYDLDRAAAGGGTLATITLTCAGAVQVSGALAGTLDTIALLAEGGVI